jgi:GNAT superfamily N-acetyltransferase
MRLETITSTDRLRELTAAWDELARAGGSGALFRSPRWLLAWWRAYREALGAELVCIAGWDGDALVFLAPLYRRTHAGQGIKLRELRLMGDAGPRAPVTDLLCAPGHEERAAQLCADALLAQDPPWDVVDLQPLRDPSRVRAFLVQRLDPSGKRVETTESVGATRLGLSLAGMDIDEVLPPEDSARSYAEDQRSLQKGLAALRRLSRLEWADREEASPLADAEATQLLSEVVADLGREGKARLARLDEHTGEAIAAALVVDDDDVAVVLALAVDPEYPHTGVATRLLAAEARAALERGKTALKVALGAGEFIPPPLPTVRRRAIHVRIFNSSTPAALARTYGSLRRRVDAAREAPHAAAAGARAAWSRIRTAAASVAHMGRLHLYRGELWIRGVPLPSGLQIATFTEADFDALDEPVRAELTAALELDEAYSRLKWRRGDLVALARSDGHPAGIAWCARSAVRVPELDREFRPGPHECYIHDVFVAPRARGRAIAPAMLEFLAAALRQVDVYRSWALIEPTNAASARAFQKAAYTAVAEIVYARMASVERVTVRPPDQEAKKLLGLP